MAKLTNKDELTEIQVGAAHCMAIEILLQSSGLHSLLEREQLSILRIQIKATCYLEFNYSKR